MSMILIWKGKLLVNKYKVSTITLSISSIILLGGSIGFAIAWTLKNETIIENIIESDDSFGYIAPDAIEQEELIDQTYSSFNFNSSDLYNFQSKGMKIVQTTYGAYTSGMSTTYIDSSDFTTVNNLTNTSYLTPYYVNGELEGMISGIKDESSNTKISNWSKDEREIIMNNNSSYDHEMFRYNDKNYILNGSNIWIGNNENDSTQKFTYSSSDGLGLPPSKDSDGERIASSSGNHFNSFDIYGENLVLNSRDYGTIYSLHILNEDGSLKEKDQWELNWVLCGNSITPYFIDTDEHGENPIISNGGDYDEVYWNYEENPDYTPTLFDEWEDKLLKIEVDGVQYDFTDITQAKEFNMLDNDHKFWGEHTVRVINSYLDSVSDSIEGYDENKLYISIHDNHFPSDVVYKDWYAEPGKYGVSWGDDPYSFHAYTEKTQELFGNNPYGIEDEISFTKVYEIDAETMVAKEVLNRNNTVSEDINQFSDYRSSSTFFSINGDSYLITESSMNSSFALVAFDGYDSDTQTLINERTIMDIQWIGEAGGYIHYRTYPIFMDVTDVAYGWNALNENPYMV